MLLDEDFRNLLRKKRFLLHKFENEYSIRAIVDDDYVGFDVSADLNKMDTVIKKGASSRNLMKSVIIKSPVGAYELTSMDVNWGVEFLPMNKR